MDGIGVEIGNPYLVIVVDINRITAAVALRQAPDLQALFIGSYRPISPLFQKLTHKNPLESDQMRRGPTPDLGG